MFILFLGVHGDVFALPHFYVQIGKGRALLSHVRPFRYSVVIVRHLHFRNLLRVLVRKGKELWFWCFLDWTGFVSQAWQPFYLLTVTVFFIIAMALQHPKMKANENFKMFVFVLWAAYGVIPTLHWTIWMGGLEHPLVRV